MHFIHKRLRCVTGGAGPAPFFQCTAGLTSLFSQKLPRFMFSLDLSTSRSPGSPVALGSEFMKADQHKLRGAGLWALQLELSCAGISTVSSPAGWKTRCVLKITRNVFSGLGQRSVNVMKSRVYIPSGFFTLLSK